MPDLTPDPAREQGVPGDPDPGDVAPRQVAISFDHASVRRRGRTVWSHGTFAIPKGDVVVVIGPNGSGKTTMLEVILGLVPLSGGTVEVLGHAPSSGSTRVGYVPQNYTATVGEAVRARDLVALGRLGTRWGLGSASADDRDRIERALSAVGATGFADQRMSTLSGGQRQRVAIAQAMVDDPDIVLLDEPLANLDLRNQHEIVDLLGELRDQGDVTVVVVAHDLNPLLPVLSGAVYLLDGHPHYDHIGEVVDGSLLTHLYGTPIRVIRTAQGDLFTRSDRP
jgi:zinc/manganese transport system ATP-binding protein